MKREQDFDLVRGLRSKERQFVDSAFEALYLKHRNNVFNLAYGILHDRALAADVTQETFFLILRKSRRFDFRSAFSSWLYRITVNRCIDARRKRGNRRPLSMSEPEIASWAEKEDRRRHPSLGPEEISHNGELARRIRQAISALNPRLSAVVVLRYMEGLGYEEVAEALELPLGTVKSRLNRAHAALEEALGPKLDELL